MNSFIRHTTLLLVLQSCFCLILLILFSSIVFPYTTDSLMHISIAQQMFKLKGMLYTNYFVTTPGPDFLPAITAPPGYPILIDILRATGINEYSGSILLPRFCFLLLPFLFFITFKKIMVPSCAMVASFVSTFMFSTVQCALMALTDIPYLVDCLVVFILVFRIIEKQGKESIFLMILSGALTGFSFLIRYVGVSLIATTLIGFLMGFLLGVISLKDFIKVTCFFIFGILVVICPYFIRNILVFGSAMPAYPCTNVSLAGTAHAYFQELAAMFFINRSFECAMLVLIIGMAIFFAMNARKMMVNDRALLICTAMLFTYFSVHSLLLIVYIVKYSNIEGINYRYLIQVAWILVGAFVVALSALFKKLNMREPLDIQGITILFLLSFLLVQIFPASDFYYEQLGIQNLSRKIEHYLPLIQRLPAGYVIVSNVADITYYLAKRNVRMLSNYTPYGLQLLLGSKRKYAVFIVKNDKRFGGYAPQWDTPYGYYRMYADGNVDFLLPRS